MNKKVRILQFFAKVRGAFSREKMYNKHIHREGSLPVGQKRKNTKIQGGIS